MNKKVLSELFFGIVVCLIGLFLMLYSEKFIGLITTILGIALILYAIYNLFVQLKANNKSLISIAGGLIIFIIGVLLVLHPSFINEFISVVIGIYIIIININILTKKIEKPITKVLAIIGIVLGVMCIIGKFLVPSIILQLAGAFLLVGGLINVTEIILMAEK